MKKTILAASAVLGILSGPVWAQTIQVTLTGSTALRSVTQQGIQNLLTTSSFKGDNSDFKRANVGRWTGRFNGKTIEIKIAWSGSYAGVYNVAGSQKVKFVADSTPGVDPAKNPDAAFESKVPDIAVGDTFQSTTPYNGKVGAITFQKLTDVIVAAQSFQFIASKNFPGSNLTSLQAQQLYTSGRIPLSLITGKSTDRNKSVFAIGRNPASGTRAIALADSAIGTTTPIKQWLPTIADQAPNAAGTNVGGHVTSHVLTPVEVVDGESTRFAGNSGFSSGSGVAAALTATLDSSAFKTGNTNATAGFYIGYLGLSDIPTATDSGAEALSWNGVKYATKKDVAEGAYSFWSYAHIFYRPNLSGDALTFAQALIQQVRAVEVKTSSTLIAVDAMQVRRTSDGGRISPRIQ